MIQLQQHPDEKWVNGRITACLHGIEFTPEQEKAVVALITELVDGYTRTISRMNWGAGWD